MSSFCILVTDPPYGAQGAVSAYLFSLAAVAAGHSIKGIFFYQGGVQNANSLLFPASDEVNLYENWVRLAAEHQISLEVCVAAALRRGVIDQSEAEQNQMTNFNLQAPFKLSGLGQLAELASTCDRLVQF